MKKLTLIAAAALLFSLPMFAQDGDKAKILTTPHDLSTFLGDNQVCATCHIPHAVQTGATTGNTQTPANLTLLWNHQLSTNTTYKMYASASLKATETALDNTNTSQQSGPQFYSLACLSCHDNSTAIGAVYRVPDNETLADTTSTIAAAFPSDGGMHVVGLNGDLSQTHPVNFTYDSTLVSADTGIWDVGNAANVKQIGTSLLTSVRPNLTKDANGALLQPILFNGTVQCASCHNPHSESSLDFLRVPVDSTNTNAGGVASLLCLKCHSTSSTYN